jgi:hypothetical protein
MRMFHFSFLLYSPLGILGVDYVDSTCYSNQGADCDSLLHLGIGILDLFVVITVDVKD